jgi:surface polysaccharide O-acyltransferase-like enzyme
MTEDPATQRHPAPAGDRHAHSAEGASAAVDSDGLSGSTRDQALDGLRFIAACAIVLQHVMASSFGQGATWAIAIWGSCHVALPIFFAVAGALHALRRPPPGDVKWLRRRWVRLMLPFFAWVLIYSARPLAAAVLFAGSSFQGGALGYLGLSLIGGGGLWFLPQLAIITTIAWALPSPTARNSVAVISLAIYAGLVVSGADRLLPEGTYWAFLPLYLAVYLGGFAALTHEPARENLWAGIVVALIAAAGLLPWLQVELSGVWTEVAWLMYPAGGLAAVMLVAIRASHPGNGATRALGSVPALHEVSLGLYLVHPLLLAPAVRLAAERLANPLWALATFVAVTLSSLAVVIALRRIPWMRRVI